MPIPKIPDDALLSTEELSAAFAQMGAPLAVATLESQRSRGTGAPFIKFNGRIVRYVWGQARDWRLAQGRALTSTSDAA